MEKIYSHQTDGSQTETDEMSLQLDGGADEEDADKHDDDDHHADNNEDEDENKTSPSRQ